jgi:predicted transposase/invertase (TIGR01784 family)
MVAMADARYRVLRTREERIAFARSMNLFSTPFMREVFKDDGATQYVLRILTGKRDLKIVQNLTEYRISKLDTRDAVLDVIAVDEEGTQYHIEIQLADNDDHILRVRFYSAMVDSELLEKGTKYKDLPNTFIFYISMNDFMKLGEPIARVNSTIGTKNKVYDDGKHIYFVNAAVDDDSEVSRLMDYFKLADPNDASHGELSDRVHLLKCEKEGEDPMCEITQSFVDEGKIIGVVEYLREDEKMADEKILEKIKERFQLNDYQARTFVYPKEAVSF